MSDLLNMSNWRSLAGPMRRTPHPNQESCGHADNAVANIGWGDATIQIRQGKFNWIVA